MTNIFRDGLSPELLGNAQANAILEQLKAVTPGVKLELMLDEQWNGAIHYSAEGVDHAISLTNKNVFFSYGE